MRKPKFEMKGVGEALFEAVSSGKITSAEYSTAIKGIKVIKKVL